MDTQIIGIKELQTRLKYYTDEAIKGKSFTVVRNTRPVFRLEPIHDQTQKKYTLDDVKKITFKSKKDLSKSIDRIVYGV